ncbi:helix-turn-helix transcriptional regulator [Qipengyuania qiaonensis]|uniref:AraC family transcriptional regulator n=1 Tax=Qipengyuania qiaonensis TaxID=2867240 RepID=A0ABS7J308_9SPHN|nr:AraC family transcriptional regulator [Qipengyuania qiaonensis]MBX7481703.1 AraC family transcriptional regulator [Qipengyuania qiaonensis]
MSSQQVSGMPEQYNSMKAFYEHAFADAITARSQLLPFDFVEASQGAGDWSDATNPDLVLAAIVGGQALGQVDVGAGKFRSLGYPGELLLTPPDTTTSIQIECHHRIVMMAVNYQGLRAACPEVPLPPDGDFGRFHTRLHRMAGLHALLMEFWQRSCDPRPWSALEIDAALHSYAWSLLLLHRGALPEHSKGGLAPWQLRRVREALEAAPQLSLVELANEVGLSPWHFCRAFRDATGLTPVRYQTALAMERARLALATSDLSVTSIALDAGFASSQAFARAFRRLNAMAPLEYRALRRKVDNPRASEI